MFAFMICVRAVASGNPFASISWLLHVFVVCFHHFAGSQPVVLETAWICLRLLHLKWSTCARVTQPVRACVWQDASFPAAVAVYCMLISFCMFALSCVWPKNCFSQLPFSDLWCLLGLRCHIICFVFIIDKPSCVTDNRGVACAMNKFLWAFVSEPRSNICKSWLNSCSDIDEELLIVQHWDQHRFRSKLTCLWRLCC